MEMIKFASSYDLVSELKAFDETKTGVKGLVDTGISMIPRIFRHPSAKLTILKPLSSNLEYLTTIPTIADIRIYLNKPDTEWSLNGVVLLMRIVCRWVSNSSWKLLCNIITKQGFLCHTPSYGSSYFVLGGVDRLEEYPSELLDLLQDWYCPSV